MAKFPTRKDRNKNKSLHGNIAFRRKRWLKKKFNHKVRTSECSDFGNYKKVEEIMWFIY
jgi:hypothetical protein